MEREKISYCRPWHFAYDHDCLNDISPICKRSDVSFGKWSSSCNSELSRCEKSTVTKRHLLIYCIQARWPFSDDDINHLASDVEKQANDQLATSIPLSQMTPQARPSFVSDAGSTFFMPVLFNESLESNEIHEEVVTSCNVCCVNYSTRP